MAKTLTQRRDFRPALNPASQVCGFLLSVAKIFLNGCLVFQVKSNSSVNTAE
jgi:hypothetical protein